ncbi:hypothetical protein RMATCC62417_16783 [Rhizopus microsporus]|nr:hypothetical protein RMATCC62417_16783 [Rhizopus microsporus]
MLILEHSYEIPSITPLHGSIASSYASNMYANVAVHLTRNLHKFLKRVIIGYIKKFNRDNTANNVQLNKKRLMKRIVDYTPLSEAEQQECFAITNRLLIFTSNDKHPIKNELIWSDELFFILM